MLQAIRASRAARYMVFLGFAGWVLVTPPLPAQSNSPSSTPNQQSNPANPAVSSAIAVPVGATVPLTVTRAVWAQTSRAGDPIYAQTAFPISIDGHMAIPAGTYVEGVIDTLTKPTHKLNRATFDLHFTKIIFANGYLLQLPGKTTATAAVTVQASTANDLLLDNGASIDMTLGSSISLDATQVARALPLSKPLQPGQLQSATLCRPIASDPGTPGTPDTVIPGTPGSPGTPDTVIPGVDGGAPTIIPGIPPTPAGPPTVIQGTPGTPGSPGRVCPAAPLVLSSTAGASQGSSTPPANPKP